MKILYVEPDFILREEVLQALIEVGYEVDSCDGPMEAISKASKQRYDLLITEYRMGEMKGTDLIRQMFAIQLIPLIIASSDPQQVMDETLGRLPIEPRLLRKPFEIWELTDLIEKSIHKA
jgi:DNA-binding response OmpR family regulator